MCECEKVTAVCLISRVRAITIASHREGQRGKYQVAFKGERNAVVIMEWRAGDLRFLLSMSRELFNRALRKEVHVVCKW